LAVPVQQRDGVATDTTGTNFQVALHLTFANGQLVEMMLYRF